MYPENLAINLYYSIAICERITSFSPACPLFTGPVQVLITHTPIHTSLQLQEKRKQSLKKITNNIERKCDNKITETKVIRQQLTSKNSSNFDNNYSGAPKTAPFWIMIR